MGNGVCFPAPDLCVVVPVSTLGTVSDHCESSFCFLASVACGLAVTEVWDFSAAVHVTWESNGACNGIILSAMTQALPGQKSVPICNEWSPFFR